TDALRLAKDHLEHGPIHRVVGPIYQRATYHGTGLAVPIHPALTLFVASWVPREIVMHHCIEVLLQIDSFRETVGSHENPWAARLPQLLTASGPFVRVELSGNRRNGRVGQVRGKVLSHIMGGGYIPAEHHGGEA